MPLEFGHALATYWPLSVYIPYANINATNTATFHPEAVMYRNRYGATEREVKGWPESHYQHEQSTFWLMDLFRDPGFLADHPAFASVVVAEPLSSQDRADLQFAADISGGAYGYLKDRADQLGLLGDKTATGPASSPGAPGVPHATPPPPPPPPAPPAPAAPPQATAASAGADPGLSAADIASIVATLKRGYPSRAPEIDAAAALLSHGNMKPVEIIAALLPVLGVTDPRVTRALGILELFLE